MKVQVWLKALPNAVIYESADDAKAENGMYCVWADGITHEYPINDIFAVEKGEVNEPVFTIKEDA